MADLGELAIRRQVIFHALVCERQRQDAKYGYDRDYPDGTSKSHYGEQCRQLKRVCTLNHRTGRLRWLDILLEEAYEVASEQDPEKLRTELIQLGAVVMNWLEALEVRK